DEGCSFTDSMTFFTPPAASFSMPADTFVCAGDSLVLYGPEGVPSYLWNTGDITDSIVIATAGTYWLTVSVCQQDVTDSVTVSVYAGNDFQVPNVFTPNHDGTNDEWFIDVTSPAYFTTYRISIYNRWGLLVWESFDAAEKWNGLIGDTPASE